MIQEIDIGSESPHFPEPRVDNNSQETTAARNGLEHHNPRETGVSVLPEGTDDRIQNIPLTERPMRTEHRMNECSLAE